MKNVYLFTGPIKSGKSSRLFEWIKAKKSVAGILSLLVDDKKQLYSISKKRGKSLECNLENSLKIGRYQFDPEVFSWARKALINDVNRNPKILIIDEIGPLELDGKGLEPAVSKVLKLTKNMVDLTIVLVVRTAMVLEIQDFYKINNACVITDLQEIT